MTAKTAQRDAAEQQAYDSGRHARAVSIARDQSPHPKGDKLRPHWEAGWDFEEEARGVPPELDNSVANDPNAPQRSPTAAKAKTARKPKKA